jgi:carboxymethylenebutenolidase
MTGLRMDVRTKEGIIDCHCFQPEGRGPWPAVIFYMDAFGVRPQLAEMAGRLASHGYFVVIPNLYYRSGSYQPFDPAQVFSEGPERTRFKSMIMSINDTMVMRDTAVVIDHLHAVTAAKTDRMGVVGYCMGGGFALSAAGTFPERVMAAASFHGGSLATDKPDSPHLLAPSIGGRVYVGVAAIDPSFSDDQKQRLQQAFDAAGVGYTLEVYDGAKHGFAVTGHMVYDQKASERHWTELLRLFRETLSEGQPAVVT